MAGGVTSFIEMPNTRPNTLSLELLEDKYQLGAQKSLANYGFLLGINAENLAHGQFGIGHARLLGVGLAHGGGLGSDAWLMDGRI